jgi:outer membrane lipoprotein-sorting protein
MSSPVFSSQFSFFGLLTSVFLFFIYSCKAPKEVVKVKMEHYSTKELLDSLAFKEFKFESLSTKADVTFFDEKETSFKAHLRVKNDSAIWISITPVLGIEMARVLITKDTVMFMDRIHNKYFIGDFAFINKMFNVELDYNMLEALLIGNSIDFEKNEKIKTAIDRKKDLYFIGTERKNKVKRDIKKDLRKDKDVLKNQTQILWVYPESFKIAELLLKDPEKEQSLQSTFSEHKLVDEQLFPFKLNFMVESKKNLKIDVEYGKVTLNNTLNFSFKIPEKYEQIQ